MTNRFAACIATLLALAARLAPASPGPTPEAVFQAATARGFQGTVWVAQAGQPAWTRSAGPLHQGSPDDGALRHDSPVRLASITKLMLSVAVLQQAAREGWSLDTPLQRLWPELPLPAARAVTVEQLLRHTSGLSMPEDLPGSQDTARRTAPSVQADALRAVAGPPQAAPGERFRYNNGDYLLLGALLERRSGQPLDALLRRGVWAPAGVPALRLQAAADPALPRQVQGVDDLSSPPERDGPVDVSRFHGSGGAVGTVPEVGRWAQALLAGRLLPPAALRTLTTPTAQGGALGLWVYDLPATATRPALTLWERQGWIGGVRWLLLMQPGEAQRVVVVMSTRSSEPLSDSWRGQGLGVELMAAAAAADARYSRAP